jgi:hypothetical protein
MNWYIEDSNMPFELVESNGLQLLNTLKQMGRPCQCIGFIPFVHEITGIGDEADPDEPSIFYGSCGMVAKVATWEKFRPGVFWDSEWFDPRRWQGKRSDLLNEQFTMTTVGALRSSWIAEATFIKSVKVKGITGQVIEAEDEDRVRWIEKYSDLAGDLELIAAPCVRIDREWRFFLVNGEVITGGTYRKDGYRCMNHPVSVSAWEAARRAAREWLPASNIVMDIARTRDGEYKVVEFNSLNASGFYKSDIAKVVMALEA